MKILVCITHVPDTTSKIKFTDDKKQLDKNGIQYIIGPYDDYALSRAIEIKEQTQGSLTVLNVGNEETEPSLRRALALGADQAVRINAEPSDAFFVASEIAHYAQEQQFDLIMMGRESIDFNGGQVHGMVGEILDIPSLSPIMKLDIDGNKATMWREIEGGKEKLEAKLPLVLGCQEPIAEWKIPNMRGIMSARTKPYEVIEPSNNQFMTVSKQFDLPAPKSACTYVDADQVEELINLLKNEAKVL